MAAASAAAATASPSSAESIARALALPANNTAGSIMDVEHIVILMQENRSFDHYFGCLRGVRGFGDPRPVTLPGGDPVWRQPVTPGSSDHVLPFRMDASTTSAESIESLDHNWKGSHALWKRHDAWVKVKSPMTMGFFQREDIPFYYALADAFTVCDAYHASIFGPTNPNRMYLFSGTCGVNVGLKGSMAVSNPLTEPNETADPQHDGPHFPGFEWTAYAERLHHAGVTWKLYQEYDNFGDNGLAYFRNFRGLEPQSPFYQKGRAWVDGSTPANAKTSRGEHLVAAFAKDVQSGALPQVSWIVAPTELSEHPKASPSYGEQLTARLLAALTDRPEVWAKTVFILNYDENDGFFDHMPPPVPPTGAAEGKTNVDAAGELYQGQPIGLGPRVPMIVVSPWSKGGFVNSELFDHTSVIRFMERRFGVSEPNITAWRRTLCGDLTSAFDFATPNRAAPRLPGTDHYMKAADLRARLPAPTPPALQAPPRQEPGQRPARPLPYDLHVSGALNPDGFHLVFANRSTVGASFQVIAARSDQGPWFYSLAPDSRLEDVIVPPSGPVDVTVHGPNGFYRRWANPNFDPHAPSAVLARDRKLDLVTLTLANSASSAVDLIVGNGYAGARTQRLTLRAKETRTLAWPLKPADHWYDLTVRRVGDALYLRRFAGHFETGQPSRTDPLMGRAQV
jgi:phospholipase C